MITTSTCQLNCKLAALLFGVCGVCVLSVLARSKTSKPKLKSQKLNCYNTATPGKFTL